jgi:hypothetical protein
MQRYKDEIKHLLISELESHRDKDPHELVYELFEEPVIPYDHSDKITLLAISEIAQMKDEVFNETVLHLMSMLRCESVFRFWCGIYAHSIVDDLVSQEQT